MKQSEEQIALWNRWGGGPYCDKANLSFMMEYSLEKFVRICTCTRLLSQDVMISTFHLQ